MPDLYSDYIKGKDALMGFFDKPPAWLFGNAPESRPWATGLPKALQEYHAALGLQCNFSGTEAVIATGQQPGLFTGPLYTLYKAITAILLARRITDNTGATCLPLFWIGADDHDFDEVRTAHILTRDGSDLALAYEPEANVVGMPMHRMPLEASLHRLIDLAAQAAPGSEYTAEINGFLHSTLDESTTLAEWFARLMAGLFRDTPLLLFSPHLSEARQAAATVIARAIREPLACTRLLNEAGRALESLGYTPQIVKGETECAFFLEVEGRRRKVLFEEDTFRLPEVNMPFSQDGLLALLHDSPERFSPNVALRCIIQQTLFPIAAYVGGPGEVAYWAQLKPLFAHFGQPMPVVYPRAQVLLAATKTRKLMQRFGFVPEDLYGPPDTLEERALRQVLRNPGLDTLSRHRTNIEAVFETLIEELDQVSKKDRQAPDMTRALSEHVQSGLDRIERTLLLADKTQAETVRKQLLRLCTALAPQRRPQERHYCAFSFLFEQGWEFVPRLLDNIDIESFNLNEVEL